jgi:hypothetical protein
LTDIYYKFLLQADVLSTVGAVNDATTTGGHTNNLHITFVNDTPEKKQKDKNQPSISHSVSSCPGSPLPPNYDLMHHLDSPNHEKINLNSLKN